MGLADFSPVIVGSATFIPKYLSRYLLYRVHRVGGPKSGRWPLALGARAQLLFLVIFVFVSCFSLSFELVIPMNLCPTTRLCFKRGDEE